MPFDSNKTPIVTDDAAQIASFTSVLTNSLVRQLAQRAAFIAQNKGHEKITRGPSDIDPAGLNQYLRGVAGRMAYNSILITGNRAIVDYASGHKESSMGKNICQAVIESVFGTPWEIFNTAQTKNLFRTSLGVMPFNLARNGLNILGMNGVLSNEKGDFNSYRDFYTKATKVFQNLIGSQVQLSEDPTKQASYILSKKAIEGAFMGALSAPFHNSGIKVLTELQDVAKPQDYLKLYKKIATDYSKDLSLPFKATGMRIFGCVVGSIVFSKEFQHLVAQTIISATDSMTGYDKVEVKKHSDNFVDKICKKINATIQIDDPKMPNPAPILPNQTEKVSQLISKSQKSQNDRNR